MTPKSNSNLWLWITLLTLTVLFLTVVLLHLWPALDLLFELATITICAACLLIPCRRRRD